MKRTITYHISETIGSCNVKQFLKEQRFSTQNIITIKNVPNSILCNNKAVHVNHPLYPGDQLTIHIYETSSSSNITPIALPIDIIYEDADLLIVNKPAGMPIHPSQNNYENTLANGLCHYYQTLGKDFTFRCVNRLDKDTSGLTIIAKHYVSAGILGSDVSKKELLSRQYLAIVEGHLSSPSGTICAPIARKEGSIIEREVNYDTGEKAITHYQVLKTTKDLSLVSLQLETGRTHQIRVHMKYLGHPLIGDKIYHPDFARINRQALHSYRLKFTHPITGEAMDFTAPIPDDFTNAFS